jgi:Na+-driven multidrug efflux pump
MFTSDPDVYRTGTLALRIISSGYTFYGIGMVMTQALNGAGDTRSATMINLFGFWIFQIPFAFLLVEWLNMGAIGSFISIPVSESMMAIAAYIFFKKGKWKTVVV